MVGQCNEECRFFFSCCVVRPCFENKKTANGLSAAKRYDFFIPIEGYAPTSRVDSTRCTMSSSKRDSTARGGGLVLPKAGKSSDRSKDRASKSDKSTTSSSASESETPKRSSTNSPAAPSSLRLPDRKEEKYVSVLLQVGIRASIASFPPLSSVSILSDC